MTSPREPITMIWAPTIYHAEVRAREMGLKPHSRNVRLMSARSMRSLDGFRFQAGDQVFGLYAMDYRVFQTVTRILVRDQLKLGLDGVLR